MAHVDRKNRGYSGGPLRFFRARELFLYSMGKSKFEHTIDPRIKDALRYTHSWRQSSAYVDSILNPTGWRGDMGRH